MSTKKIDKNLYLDPIKQLIKDFNDKWDSEFEKYGDVLPPELHKQYKDASKKLTQALYQETKTYFKTYHGAENFKVIQLFRHGECTNADKGYGFKPNANINAVANENMKSFGYSALLHNKKDDVRVIFSTMTRATVTAANFIAGLRAQGKKVTPKSSREITEIAEGPSGFDITDWREYGPLLNPFSDVKFFHRVLLFFSFIRYAVFGNTLTDNMHAKQTALDAIGPLDGTSKPSDVTHTTDAQRENGLAKEIVDEIDNDDPRDMLVVGHGNSIRDTLTKFFPCYEEQRRENDELRFAESQGLMAFEVDGKKELFMLPFRIQVDQHKHGKMNVRYVPFAEVAKDYQGAKDKIVKRDLEVHIKEVEKTDALDNPSYGTFNRYDLITPNQKETTPELIIKTESYEQSSDQNRDELGFTPPSTSRLSLNLSGSDPD